MKNYLWLVFGLALACSAAPSLAATKATPPTPAELLEPEMAFQFSATLDAVTAKSVSIKFNIADGYYLYRNKLKFSVEPTRVAIGKPVIPKGLMKKDKIFGRVETYRHALTITLPFVAALTEPIYLTVVSQGCADVGVCYQPMKSRIRLSTLPDAALETANPSLSSVLKRAPPRPTEAF